jgi:hypothetical protein
MKPDKQAQKTSQKLFKRIVFFFKKIQVDQPLEKVLSPRKSTHSLDIPDEELYKPFTSLIAHL